METPRRAQGALSGATPNFRFERIPCRKRMGPAKKVDTTRQIANSAAPAVFCSFVAPQLNIIVKMPHEYNKLLFRHTIARLQFGARVSESESPD